MPTFEEYKNQTLEVPSGTDGVMHHMERDSLDTQVWECTKCGAKAVRGPAFNGLRAIPCKPDVWAERSIW